MKISKIEVKNYRLLKNFSIDLEDKLSLVVGKNNCGKSSLLSVMDKFLNSSSFSFDDFNLDYKEKLKQLIEDSLPNEEKYKQKGIALKFFIEYTEKDNLANVSKLMMDLDPKNNNIELLFEYILTFDQLKVLKNDYSEFKEKEKEKTKPKDLDFFLKENHKKYFKLFKKSIDPSDNKNFIDIEKEKISLKEIISYEYIKANRDVSNKEADKSLSSLSASIYEKIEADDDHQSKIDKFKEELYSTDDSLNKIYENIFESSIEKVRKLGGIKPDDTNISITSTLQHKDLLKGNTTVLYKHDDHYLPESYNGLGYMNLISMIFEIEILINKFKRPTEDNPADINLLFIEEPEAHTHPQMQHVFIKNIKELLSEEVCLKGKLQYIVSTHSSHIVSESNFDDIKYLKRENNNVIANNLNALEMEYVDNDEEQNYKFLKQYLTLHRAELFFADKAIFIEGDTERILLPAMMKKIDQTNPNNPLLSQNISIVETGAYSHIFEKFINFIGIKSLIITDIDSAKVDKQKCQADDPFATITTNSSLAFFYGNNKLDDFKEKTVESMTLMKDKTSKKWVKDKDGFLVCVYQTSETNKESMEYHARSFEDAFFHLNRKFITDDVNKAFIGLKGDTKKGLKKFSDFSDNTINSYELAQKCVNKKPALAIEILINSETNDSGNEFCNWQTPDYINQGLLWLKD